MGPDSPSTSLTLLNQLRQSPTDAAWERFVNLYAPLLRAWALRDLRNRDDAADLVQIVLLKLQSALPKYQREDGKTFHGWLRAVTANAAHDFRRAAATRPLPREVGFADGTDEPFPDADRLGTVRDNPPPDIDELEHRRFVVNRALALVRAEFSEPTWAAFAGVMLHNRPAAEVAAELGTTPNAVFLARHRVLARLRREIEGLLD